MTTTDKIAASVFAAFGAYPIFEINEFNADPEMDGIYGPGDSYLFDTAKLVGYDDISGRLDYVQFIFDAIVTQKGRGYSDFQTTTSRKYSFGDTPRWWDDFRPVGVSNDHLMVSVEIG